MTWRLGWRNLWRNSKRSWITVAAVASAYMFLIGLSGLMAGLQTQLLRSGTGLLVGEVHIHHKDYLPDRKIYDWVGSDSFDLRGLLQRIRQADGIREATVRVQGMGLLSTGTRSSGVQILGIDPVSEPAVSTLPHSVVAGQGLAGAADHSVLMGDTLATIVGAEIGSEVAIVTQAADGTMGNDLYRVRGLIHTGLSYLDRALVVADWHAVQRLLVLQQNQVHEIVIRTADPLAAGRVAAGLDGLGLDRIDAEVQTWRELLPQLADFLRLSDSMTWIIVTLVGLFAGFGVLNTMLMAVFERTREMGILIGLGMKPRRVVVMLATESLVLSVLGLLIGFGAGAVLMFYLENTGLDLSRWMKDVSMANIRWEPVMKAMWAWDQVALAAVGLFLCLMLATLIPAWKAARIRPVEAIYAPTEG